MKYIYLFTAATTALLLSGPASFAEIKVVVEHNDNEHAVAGFKFKNVPAPSKSDAATKAKLTIVDGERDDNGGGLDKLNDGKVPTEADEPAENFFFNAGTEGGRILADLGSVLDLKQVNTYSWHPNTRGPQVYKLYASEGKTEDFNPQPKRGTEPEKCGWKLLARVDTRSTQGEGGGQYGVSIADPEGTLGEYRYLLFDISRTEADDDFGNTFYSELDVIDKDGTADAPEAAASPFMIRSPDGYCEISIDTSGAPDLKEWAEQKLGPVLAEWYPKIVAMLPSEGYSAPKRFSVTIKPGNGVAATGGTRVTANSTWLKGELKGEAVGALVHEEVHVVQQYRGRRGNPDFKPAPGWLVEGIPDYIRWFLYEPQSHGADVAWLRTRRNVSLKYDARYRVTANFLNYVVEHYDPKKELITKLNAACRQGQYTDDLWQDCTGQPLLALNDEWKTATEKQLQAPGAAAATADPAAESNLNTLTEAEKTAGWKLLFNGKDFTGWHNFKREGVRPGWEVKEGELVCADPHNAGDIVTVDQYDSFELQLDYNISVAGNSGIMYHVTDKGGAAWATGPEFQLEDNKEAADPVRCGWLYALYQPPTDPKTGKPLDATKPAGQWNHVRLLITPEKCEHEINGVKYFEYVLGSEDFTSRVAKSKFSPMPDFAKSNTGYLALQGDHGRIAFRNIKIRLIASGK
jgi:hypothetical protein